jgi:hypothetical protein
MEDVRKSLAVIAAFAAVLRLCFYLVQCGSPPPQLISMDAPAFVPRYTSPAPSRGEQTAALALAETDPALKPLADELLAAGHTTEACLARVAALSAQFEADPATWTADVQEKYDADLAECARDVGQLSVLADEYRAAKGLNPLRPGAEASRATFDANGMEADSP